MMIIRGKKILTVIVHLITDIIKKTHDNTGNKDKDYVNSSQHRCSGHPSGGRRDLERSVDSLRP